MTQSIVYLVIAFWLFVFSALFTAEQERILGGKPLFRNKWWARNNWYWSNKYMQWIMRYPLSFLKDGWHFCKTSAIVTHTFGVIFATVGTLNLVYGYSIVIEVEFIYTLTLTIYIVSGIFFSYLYHRGSNV